MVHPLKFFVSRPVFMAFAFGTVLLLEASFGLATPRPDEPPSDLVGVIEGDAIAVSGPMKVDVVNGQVHTMLRSGSDVRVKSGQARIDLVEGGDILICGPAHFSVLKSAGALTVALESGTIHARIKREPAMTVYTAQVQATPVLIGDSPEDLTVGFDATGAMCVRAASGAVRLEQQLTGQSVIVPQNGDVLIANGQLDALRTASGRCSCELQVAAASPPPAPPSTRPEISVPATPEDIRRKQAESNLRPEQQVTQKPDATQEPIYQVFMPPLAYDATAKVQRDFDPRFILLVRRVRVRPTLIFQGRVEGDPVVVASDAAPRNPAPANPQANQQATPKPATENADDTVLNRVRSFFHRLWTSGS